MHCRTLWLLALNPPSARFKPSPPAATFTTMPIEHLVTWQEAGGRVGLLALDADCRPVSITTLFAYR
jgi:hypothetical protein